MRAAFPSGLPLQPAASATGLRAPNHALSNIRWHDLVRVSVWEKAWELSLPLPWLLLSLVCYSWGDAWIGLGALGSFYLFLTGLRLSHGAQHYSLGVSKRGQNFVLFGLSTVMLASMHAVQVSHLNHHQHCLQDDDTEGAVAHLKWWQAFFCGPAFLAQMHRTGWRLGSAPKRRWILFELCGIGLVIVGAFTLPGDALRWHVAAMLLGECMTGFFAVWTVHHDCGNDAFLARTQRGRWVNRLCYGMFYHAEHHLFPAVPTCHLAALAQRIDNAARPNWRQVIEMRPREGRPFP